MYNNFFNPMQRNNNLNNNPRNQNNRQNNNQSKRPNNNQNNYESYQQNNHENFQQSNHENSTVICNNFIPMTTMPTKTVLHPVLILCITKSSPV